MTTTPATTRLKPHLRIDFGHGIRLGPGKIELLAAIAETGSISGAGRKIGMSYRRAWLLVDEINSLFLRPVVSASAGGAHGGGAQITDLGRAVVAAYERIELRARAAIQDEMAVFAAEIASNPVDDETPGPERRPG
jgi:molybdate transport system regulatory protein